MQYVKLGSTGLDVSRICLGCMTYGVPDRGTHEWTLDEEASRPLIRQALEAGITFFDTANVYSDGTSERDRRQGAGRLRPPRRHRARDQGETAGDRRPGRATRGRTVPQGDLDRDRRCTAPARCPRAARARPDSHGRPAHAQRRPGGQLDLLGRTVRRDQDGRRVSGPGHGAAPGHRVVHHVQARRAHLARPVVAGLLGQPHHQVVEVGEQLLGRQVDVGEGAHGGPQPSHGGRGGDAVADHVPDDHGHPHPGQRDDVEPVAADARAGRGEVAGRRLHRGGWRQPPGQQAALQGQRGLALARVAAGVVDADRGAGADLLGQQHVVVGEGVGAPEPGEDRDAEGGAAGLERHRHRGVDAVLPHPSQAGGVPLEPAFEVAVGHRGHDGLAREQTLGLGRAGRIDVQLPGLGHRLRAVGGDRAVRGAAQADRRFDHGGGLAAVLARVQQVDADEVGERRDAHVRQLLRRTGDVEGGADAHAGLVDQLQPLAGAVLLREVVGADAHAEYLAAGVGQRCDTGVPRVGAALAHGLETGLHVGAGDRRPARAASAAPVPRSAAGRRSRWPAVRAHGPAGAPAAAPWRR
ncbi:hypothetical protein SVIOM342S_08297 [Streptomyces violaceorubidus]